MALLTSGRSLTARPAAAVRRAGRVAVVCALGLGVVALPAPASADVLAKPARTWGVNGRVSVVLPVGDRVVLGGSFTSLVDPSGVSYPAKNIAVVNAVTGAGDLDFTASTDTGVGTEVTALATDGTRLFVGGVFKSLDGKPQSNLGAVDLSTGALAPGWTASANASVDALTVVGTDLYVGGLFAGVRNNSTTMSQPFLAKLSTSTGAVDTAWSPRPDNRVRALTPAADGSDRLFLGGDFLNVTWPSGSAQRRRAAAVDLAGPGTLDSNFNPGMNNGSTYSQIIGLTADANRLYAAVGGGGGACTAYDATTGSTVWSDHSNGNMQSVRLLNGLLYCGGHYGGTGSFAGLDRQKLAAVDPATGSVTAFAPQFNSPLGIWSMAADANHLYVGGDFTAVTGVPQPHFAEFPTTQTTPTAPSLFAQPDNAAVHLSWTAPSTDGGSSLTKYKLYRSTTSGSFGSTPLATLGAGTRMYDDAQVVNSTTYYYKLVALNGIGESPASLQSARPDSSIVVRAPGAPVGLTATNPPGYVQLTWNPPTDNGGAPINRYKIYRATSSGAETFYVSNTSTSYRDTLITAGTTYFYEVTAVNSADLEGVSSNEDSTMAQAGLPGTPVLSGSAGTKVAYLSWTVPTDGGTPITKYVVTRDGVRIATLGAGVTSYTDTGRTTGTAYTYQVRAANAQGNGPYSNRVTVTPS